MKKVVITLVLAIIIFYFFSSFSFEDLTGRFVKEEIISEQVNNEPVILFCPRDNCEENFVFLINKTSKIHCALFDLDLEPV
ncbi:hypothetical protein KY339_01160, partial [Candidatus Woesearchaeota archaeon]|nr:hypothetical protein [Candidatus Woesearchaeota archaeon]